jgi:hypothetical protein
MKATIKNGKSTVTLFNAEKKTLRKALEVAQGIKRLSDDPDDIEWSSDAANCLEALLSRFDPDPVAVV